MIDSRRARMLSVIILLILIVLSITICILKDFGDAKDSKSEYETKLFDTSIVHNINIDIKNWNKFIREAENEEYVSCTITIDGETLSKVGIRCKGYSSLKEAISLGTERHSFKIEFDHYNNGQTYYGLDKLCLNNMIWDNTYMKDYISYELLRSNNAPTPLCSYVNVSINGEKLGLYLAVEAVEESFIRRNYGTKTGKLYKPDTPDEENRFITEYKLEKVFKELGLNKELLKDIDATQYTSVVLGDIQDIIGGEDYNRVVNALTKIQKDKNKYPDVQLQYISNSINDYGCIFNNSQFDTSNTDKMRLIRSLKAVSESKNLDTVLSIDELMGYFTVHNFVVNGDSYTGDIVHNYYLREYNGKLSIIPWDYNLAFGAFREGTDEEVINKSIYYDTEVIEGRALYTWITADEEYKTQYNETYRAFIEGAEIQELIDNTTSLIAEHVKDDPTSFCVYEDFKLAVDTLKTFCELRVESVMRQFNGDNTEVDTQGINIKNMGNMDKAFINNYYGE